MASQIFLWWSSALRVSGPGSASMVAIHWLHIDTAYINVSYEKKNTWFILMLCVKDITLYMIHMDGYTQVYIYIVCYLCMVDHAVRFMAWTMNCPGGSFSAHIWSAGPRAQRPTLWWLVLWGKYPKWSAGPGHWKLDPGLTRSSRWSLLLWSEFQGRHERWLTL